MEHKKKKKKIKGILWQCRKICRQNATDALKTGLDATEAGLVAIASNTDSSVETKGKNKDRQQNEGHQWIRGQALIKIHKRSTADTFWNSTNATDTAPAAPALNTNRDVGTGEKNSDHAQNEPH